MAFAEKSKKTKPEKVTDYKLDGKRVTLTKQDGNPNKPRRATNPLFFPLEKKVEAASLYCVLGNVAEVARLAKLDEKIIRQWKEETWWADIQRKIVVEQNEGLLSKINNTIDQALVMLEDRIVNGDCVYLTEKIGKDGNLISEEKTVRVPVKARDLAQIFNAMSHQRNLMRGDPTQIVSQTSTETRLLQLQERFTAMSKGTVLDGECKTIEPEKEEDGPQR